MNDFIDSALAQLRAADPTATTLVPDPRSAIGQAMLEQVLAAAEPTPVRRLVTRRRVFVGSAVAAAAAAATVVGVVTPPWSNGHPATAAYAVDKHADGSISVTVHLDELRDPAALNAKLQGLGARTVVMAISAPGQCTTPIAIDPAHSGIIHVDLRAHPELSDPAKFRAYVDAQSPWVDGLVYSTGGWAVTIHPDQIPAGNTLLMPYEFAPTPNTNGPSDNGPVQFGGGGLLVPAVPSCVPAPGDSVYTSTGVEIR